ncbi:MAG TPA: zinc-dependent metalloprotease, partial [Propionibacteriaceae bacterium]|nr:zinc-dependent metalloprotease [Propionibacteriaceae bacterium]
MSSAFPTIDWAWAERTGHRLVPIGPEATDDEKHELVADLRESARRAPALVAEAAGLSRTGNADERVVDRLGWISGNVAIARSVVDHISEPELDSAGKRVAAKVIGTQLGTALAFLATKVLGQYDPFSEHPSLMLVAPNVMHIERELHFVPHDFRMWVCLHEQTHRVQFATAPWLSAHLLGLVRVAVDEELGSGDSTTAMVGRVLDHV